MRNLSEIVKQCRDLGVLQYKEGDFEIILGPEPVQPETSVKAVDNSPKEVKSGKRGKDGLTAKEQLDNYGVVVDAEE